MRVRQRMLFILLAVAACSDGSPTDTVTPDRATPMSTATPTSTATAAPPSPTATASATATPGTPSPSPTATPEPGPTAQTLQQNLGAKKNRISSPSSYAYATLEQMRALPDYGSHIDDVEFADLMSREEAGVWIEGELLYFIRVADGQLYGSPPAQGDWHIEVRPRSDLGRDETRWQAIVTEITPPWQASHPDWSEALMQTLARYQGDTQINSRGASVRVFGWLLYDYEHVDIVGTRRGSAWELHPITRLEYFDESSSTWVEVP